MGCTLEISRRQVPKRREVPHIVTSTQSKFTQPKSPHQGQHKLDVLFKETHSTHQKQFQRNSKLALTTLEDLFAFSSLSALRSCSGLSLLTSYSQPSSSWVIYNVNQQSRIFPLVHYLDSLNSEQNHQDHLGSL